MHRRIDSPQKSVGGKNRGRKWKHALNRGHYPFLLLRLWVKRNSSYWRSAVLTFWDPVPFTLSPTDPKINRSSLLNKDIHYMKFEGSGWKERLLLSGMCSPMEPLWLWPTVSKIISVFSTQEGLSFYELSRFWVSYWAKTNCVRQTDG